MATTAAKPKKTTAKSADGGPVERLQTAVNDVERMAERASGDARSPRWTPSSPSAMCSRFAR